MCFDCSDIQTETPRLAINHTPTSLINTKRTVPAATGIKPADLNRSPKSMISETKKTDQNDDEAQLKSLLKGRPSESPGWVRASERLR